MNGVPLIGGDVPIIGAPKIGDWSFSFVVTCPCGNSMLYTGKPAQLGGAMLVCKCKRVFALMGMPSVDDNGKLHVPLGVHVPGPEEGK